MLREARDDGAVTLTIDRPSSKNALSLAVLQELEAALGRVRGDASVRAVVLTGAGGSFAAGGDLKELRAVTTEADAENFRATGGRVCEAIEALPVPVVALLTGPAIGGGAELALACDVRIAEEGASITFKQVRMGVTTAWGSVARLVSLVGHGAAARLLFEADDCSAARAFALGLVNHLVPSGGGHAEGRAVVRRIASGAPLAIAETKRLLVLARKPLADAVGTEEASRFVRAWMGAEHAEAMAAYFEKRSPNWGLGVPPS